MMPLVEVARNETTDARTGVVTVTPVLRDLDELKVERRAELRATVWSHVDSYLDARERETLAALHQRVLLLRALSLPVDEWAALALLSVLSWMEDTLIAWTPLAAAVDAAETLADVQAVTLDLDALGSPPAVTAAEIAAALRGAG
jgi:hypothetical protein